MTVFPICAACSRYQAGSTCEAFPQGIPDAIAEGGYDHRQPFAGDHGILFDLGDDDALVLYETLRFDGPPEPVAAAPT